MTDLGAKIEDTTVLPSATPTDEEITIWNSYSREKQLRLTREMMDDARQSGYDAYPVTEVKARALRQLAADGE